MLYPGAPRRARASWLTARMLWETVHSVKREKLPQYSCSLKPTEVREILYCFHLLVIVNNAAVSICVTVVVWMSVFKSLGYKPRNVVIGLYGNLYSTF